jgi:hypothetical protein
MIMSDILEELLISGINLRFFNQTVFAQVEKDVDGVSLKFRTPERDVTIAMSYEKFETFQNLIKSIHPYREYRSTDKVKL